MAPATAAGAGADGRLDALFAGASGQSALLRLVLQEMPKGADLHRHSEGAIFAEDFVRWAAEKDGCLVDGHTLAAGPCAGPTTVPLRDLETKAPATYADALEAMSMGRHTPTAGDPSVSGHERFFDSFRRFSFATRGERARIVAINREQAAFDHIHYLELMSGPSVTTDPRAAFSAEPWSETDLAGRLDRLSSLIARIVAEARASADADDRRIDELNGCGATPRPAACDVTLRYLMTIGRESAPEQVFGRLAIGFALAAADPRWVGVNIAQPEDGPISLRDYSLHMRLFAFFRARYPDVPTTLHAGELRLGLAPPRDLRFHIREAVEIAGARRIGHGVDIAYEDDAPALLARMARDHIAVEVNLTSNDVILGVKGGEHPLRMYLAAGVPVALSSDDQGVARSDLTQDYVRAVTEQGLRYTTLRQISRDSLTWSFLPGESLWDASGHRRRKECAGSLERPAAACRAILDGSVKAREQRRLELALAAYEAALPDLLARLGAPTLR